MKKKYLLLIIYICTSNVFAQTQIPNGNFENWSINPNFGYLTPDGWDISGTPDSVNVIQAPGHTGNYSVHLRTIYDPINQELDGAGMLSGLPIINKPDQISGYWKIANPISIDRLLLDYQFHDSLGGNIGGYTHRNTSDTAWTYFVYSLVTLTGIPSDVSLSFMLPDQPISSNLYAEIDEVQFIYLGAGANDLDNTITQFDLYPTNSTGVFKVKVSVTRKNNLSFAVLDLSGKIVSEIINTPISFGTHEIPFDLNLANGMYMLRMNAKEGSKCLKFSIQK